MNSITSLTTLLTKLTELKVDTIEFLEFLIEKVPALHAEFVEKTKKMFGTLMHRASCLLLADEEKVKAIDLFKLKKDGGMFNYVYIADSLKEEMEKEYEVRPIPIGFFGFEKQIYHSGIKATACKYSLMQYFNPVEAHSIFKEALSRNLLIKGKNGLLAYGQTESGVWFQFGFWLRAGGEVDVSVLEVDPSDVWYLGDIVALCDIPLETLKN